MLNRLTLVVGILVLAVAPVVGGVACGVCGGDDKAELPILRIGDRFVFEMMEEDDEGEKQYYEVSYEVTREEIVDENDCYVVEVTIAPAPERLSNVEGTVWIEKATTWPIKSVTTADADYGGGQIYPVVITEEVTYEFAGEFYWPLEVGKEVEVTETRVETVQTGDYDPNVGDPEEKTRIYKVDSKKEDKEVEAGIFECFKVEEYDEDGNKVSTAWYSEEAKVDIFDEDYDENYDDEEDRVVDSKELVSYSLA